MSNFRMMFTLALVATVSTICVFLPSAVSSSVTWSVNNEGNLFRNGLGPVMIRGFSTTCLEYILRGIGTPCLAQYDFTNTSNIIRTINRRELDAIYSLILPAPSSVVPAIRFTLNAGYYLDVVTPRWQASRNQFLNLSSQYRDLIDTIVTDVTSRGIVTILDLHWNDDVLEQEPMALKGTATSGDSLTFWDQLSARYASNPLVWFELYNEPFAASYDIWLNGNAQFEGMKPMVTKVKSHNVKGLILVSGAFNFSYDAASLIRFSDDVASMDQIAFVIHPYMGPLMQGDPSKNAAGFASKLEAIRNKTKRPVIATEFGQFNCAAEGLCFQYPGTHRGLSMGYVRALLVEMHMQSTGWTAWGWRPGTGGDATQPDVNDGTNLYSSANHGGLGADWANLFPTFYPAPPEADILDVVSQPSTSPPTVIRQTTQAPVPDTVFPQPFSIAPVPGGLTDAPAVATVTPPNASSVGVGIGVTALVAGLAAGLFLFYRKRSRDIINEKSDRELATAVEIYGRQVFCVVVEPYAGTEMGELSLRKGEIVLLLQRSSGGWWEGQLTSTGESGLFPSECVRPTSRTWANLA